MTKSLGLALGGGGARGVAHIAVLEVLDEMGVVPTAIAGASVGAMIGAAFAAGFSGRDIRRHVIALAHDRTEVLRRLVAARAGSFASLFSGGFGTAAQVDGEKFCEQFMPAAMPEDFGGLRIPLMVIASDLYRREQVVITSGPLRRAIAASIALPTLVRPVVIDDRVLVDGGATNPLPFDTVSARADVVMAVDISGEPNAARRDIPSSVGGDPQHHPGDGTGDYHREAQARRAGPYRAAERWPVPHARFLPGKRRAARVRAVQGGDQAAAGGAADVILTARRSAWDPQAPCC